MKARILAAVALAVALPAAAQANSFINEQIFEQQSEPLNTQQTAQYQALPTANRVDTVSGGHSAAADQALQNVAEETQLSTQIPAGGSALVAQGHSAAAAQALINANQTGQDSGNVSFTSL
ncbi:hypothetical protein [Salinicola tamaricis]|uniref:hypothetical protein n=1 Tax=Salinicola tamaricis TaxID=1771309 RepID=UPI000D0A1078|nr:hypothetical protein [Salinicola tamaricis]